MAENRSPDNLNSPNLQQEAIRRAREMQARAHLPTQGYSAPPRGPEPSSAAPNTHSEQMPIHPPGNGPERPEKPPTGVLGGALDFLLKDQERTLILMLMLILLEEKANIELIFALLYMLL